MSRIRIANSGEITGEWTAQHAPAANTQATITRRAPPKGFRNVVTGITVTLVAGASAPTATTVSVALIDGATGGTTYLWGPINLGMPAVAGATNGIARSALWIQGTVDTATTLEFSAAAGANTIESIAMEGTVEQA